MGHLFAVTVIFVMSQIVRTLVFTSLHGEKKLTEEFMTDFLGESGSMNDLIKKSGKGEVVIIAHRYTSTGYGMREKIGERLERENPDKLFLYLNWEMDTGLTGSVKNIMEGFARGEINAEMRFFESCSNNEFLHEFTCCKQP